MDKEICGSNQNLFYEEKREQYSLGNAWRGRRRFFGILGFSIVAALSVACSPSSVPKITVSPTPTVMSPSEAGYRLEPGEIGQTLGYGEAINIAGKIEYRNSSHLANLAIAMNRINQQTGTEAGLLRLNRAIVINFVDQSRETDTTGGDTYFNPQTGKGESEVVVPKFVDKLKKEIAAPNTVLTTANRKNGYLGVLLSQAVLVEISNQANIQRYTGQIIDSNIQEQIDKASNQLGVKYTQEVINGQAKPFIIVNEVKLSN